jgi:hypothetical protein
VVTPESVDYPEIENRERRFRDLQLSDKLGRSIDV